MSARRVLVTGPVESLAEYAQAARDAGWEPVELALLEIEPVVLDPTAACSGDFDRIAVTSASALPFLAEALRAHPNLARVPANVVGARTAERAREIGLRVDGAPADDADELARTLTGLLTAGARVLWPHGDRSDELANVLRARGALVEAPIVYRVRPARAAGPPPTAEAIFFASPSAVRAWRERAASSPRIAIAIGRTTFDALLAETAPAFFDTISLPSPSPEAFGQVLGHLDSTTPS